LGGQRARTLSQHQFGLRAKGADCDMDWALFRNLAPDPWPKVQSLMKVA
jgi:hypothetical protein